MLFYKSLHLHQLGLHSTGSYFSKKCMFPPKVLQLGATATFEACKWPQNSTCNNITLVDSDSTLQTEQVQKAIYKFHINSS